MPYAVLARPGQWIKNLLVLTPVFFAEEAGNYHEMRAALLACAVFTGFSVAAYAVNDIIDRHEDALHPVKRFRPVASGVVSPAGAAAFAALVFCGSAWVLFAYVPQVALVMAAYALLVVLYSAYLKRVPLVDIFTVSSFYLLRVAAGGSAIGVVPSRWLVACVMFLSLFVVIGKRRSECTHSPAGTRPVLTAYAAGPYGMRDMFDRLLLVSGATALSSYGAYAILAVHSNWAVYSLFFAMFGIFRYLFLVYGSAFAESAEVALAKDMPLLFSVIGWVVFMYCAVYRPL